MKLQQNGNKKGFHLSIPVAIVNAYNWKPGTELKLEIGSNKSIIIKEQ